MARSYQHIKEYEKEIQKMVSEGRTHREIGEALGFTKEQIKCFIHRERQKYQKIGEGIIPKKKGRPSKDYVVTEEDKIADLKYKLARKDAYIKQLEMENELMRDFLSQTGRK